MSIFAKETFFLKANVAATLAEEADLVTGDVHVDGDPGKPLVYASDFAPFKPRADLFIVGVAYAPGGRAVSSFQVTMRIGKFAKSLRIYGNRNWKQTLLGGLTISDPEPIVKVPVTYENAFGGPEFSKNPVGRGHHSESAPNIENPQLPARGPKDDAEPAGFGPLSLSWGYRQGLMGTYKEKWLKERWPWFAEDFDWGFFNAAPRDQQIEGYLRGDEELEFENLRPKHPIYRSRLPGLRARCFLNERMPDGEFRFREVPLNLDTLWINMEEEKLILVWRGLADVRTIKLKEIEHLLAVTESLSEPAKDPDHYRKTLLAAPAPAAEQYKEAAPQKEGEDQARLAEMEKRAAEAEKELALAEQEALRYEAEAQKKVADQKAALIASGVDPKLLEPAAAPQSLAEVGGALAASLAQFKASNPQQAAKLAEIDLSFFQEIEKEIKELETETKAPEPAKMTRVSVQAGVVAGQALENQDLSELNLSGMDLAKAKLAGAVLRKANLKGANLTKANLSKADLTGADLSKVDLTGAVLDEADLTGAVLSDAKLSGVSLTNATLFGLDLKGADFSAATGKGADFSKSKLAGARFTSARLPQADFSECALDKANFSGAELQGARFQNVKATQINMEGARIAGLQASSKSVFSKGNFKKVNGPRSIWEEATLDGADFSHALLSQAQFSEASLRNAVFDRADLSQAAFDDACLRGAVLTKANVLRATFDRADLSEAKVDNSNFFEAGFWETQTAKTDLHKANVKSTLLS
jgi:uncharacterized protein YjbI with pentapeptide repeats